MTTRAVLVSQVEAIIDRDDLTSRIQTAFNTVMDRIARRYDFQVLMDEDTSVVTVASQFTYTLPSATNRIYRLIHEDGSSSTDLVEISAGEFDRRYPYPSSLGTSTPSVYCRRNETTIDICNPPTDSDKVLRIYRSIFPTHFTSDSSEPEYVRMDDVLVSGVISEIYHQLGLMDDADTWNKKFQSELKDAFDKDGFMPHRIYSPKFFGWSDGVYGDYWANPFYKG